MNELTTQSTAVEIRADVNLIQEVMQKVMKENVHFGIIPGCDKPSLYKAGSEKLLSTFRLSVEPEVEDLSSEDEARYRVKTKIVHIPTGNFVGCGIGECSSDEGKYKWRKAVCNEEYDETFEDRKREKWSKPKTGNLYKVKQVRTEIADVANTILKMAKKRSQIDGTLTAIGASDIFTQDIEDIPKEILNQNEPQSTKPAVEMPQAKESEKPKSSGDVISVPQSRRLYAISKGSGMTDDGFREWLLYTFEYESSTNILKSDYEKICESAKVWKA